MEMVCAVNPLTGQVECGTGGYIGPQPGDPNLSDIIVKATPAYGGIDVEWTWPDINPNAVSYTIVYRSLLPDPDSAAVLRFAQGSSFFDRVDQSAKYFYWVQMVSIYGTKGEMRGPASATAKARIEQTIEELTGKIDAGVLSQSLKSEIDRIELNHLNITQEMLDRAQNDTALGVRINEIGAYTGDTRALLQEEVLARTTANEAFVTTVNTLYATVNGNIASVQTQVTALATDVSALSSKVDRLEAQVGEDLAQVITEMKAEIAVVDGKVTAIGARWTAQVNVNGLVGGFGVYNDGRTVEAGFDVDRFWVGRTNANKRKPFIIENNVTYIDDAAINKLTFNKLRDESGAFIVENGKIKADYITVGSLTVNNAMSDNYVANTSGWILRNDGYMEFNGPVAGGGRLQITNQVIRVYDSANTLRVRMGIWG